MELSTYLTDESLVDYGKQIYQTNDTFRRVAEFMEHPMSREFYNECLNKPNIESTLFFLWLYDQVEQHNPDLMPYEKLALAHKAMHERTIRQKIFNRYSDANKMLKDN